MGLKQFIFSFLLLLIFISCNKKTKENTIEEFLIQVDSITIPAQISRGEQLSIQFYGEVGPNKSYQFDRIITETDSVKTSFMLIGKRNTKLQTTDSITQYLENISYQFYPDDTIATTLELINPGYMNKTKYTVEIASK